MEKQQRKDWLMMTDEAAHIRKEVGAVERLIFLT